MDGYLAAAALKALPFEQRLLRVFCDFATGQRPQNGSAVPMEGDWDMLRWQGLYSYEAGDTTGELPVSGWSRAHVYGVLQEGGVSDFLSRRVHQSVLWEHFYSSYAFVASPIGRGIDCYRTYEILAMGAVPIVQKVRGFSVFQDLPVVEVDDWSQVTLTNLAHWAKKLGAQAGSPQTLERLTARHWLVD